MFQDSLSVPSSRVKETKENFLHITSNYQTTLHNIPGEWRSHLHHRRSLEARNEDKSDLPTQQQSCCIVDRHNFSFAGLLHISYDSHMLISLSYFIKNWGLKRRFIWLYLFKHIAWILTDITRTMPMLKHISWQGITRYGQAQHRGRDHEDSGQQTPLIFTYISPNNSTHSRVRRHPVETHWSAYRVRIPEFRLPSPRLLVTHTTHI